MKEDVSQNFSCLIEEVLGGECNLANLPDKSSWSLSFDSSHNRKYLTSGLHCILLRMVAYDANCHCQAVKLTFEVDVPLEEREIIICNCTHWYCSSLAKSLPCRLYMYQEWERQHLHKQ